MEAISIIRAAIPDADVALVEHIVWGRTPYPFAKITPRRLYTAASRLRRANANGIRLCDWCDNKVAQAGDWTCPKCTAALASAATSKER